LVGKEPTLGLFGQFLLTKMSLSRLSIYKWHLLWLVTIPTKEKIFSIYIKDPTMPKIWLAKKATTRNIDSCLAHQSKGHV
jgi:hypothetical protein